MKKIISVILAVAMLIGMGAVLGIEAEAVSLSAKSVKLVVGEEEFIFLNGADSGKIEWSTSDKTVATVDDGVIKGVNKGKATVTAKYKKKTYKCSVTVSEYRIERESSSVMVGNRLQLDLIGWNGERTWISSDEDIATVTKDGIVRGVSAGKAKISVKIKKDGSIYTTSFTLTVNPLNFPVTASKTAYIKLSTEGAYGKNAKYFPIATKYIIDKKEIKSVLSYANELSYSFVEPEDMEEIIAEGYTLGKEYTAPESLIFYDASGNEIGRFETALIDSAEGRTENILGYFRYNQKYYKVNGTSNLINEIYGWKTNEELYAAAEEYFEDKFGKRRFENLTSDFYYTGDHPDYKTGDGISFRTDYGYSGGFISIYFDPVTGEAVGWEELSDD